MYSMMLMMQMLESTLRLFNATAVPPGNKPIDPRADPKSVKSIESDLEIRLNMVLK